MNYIYDSLLDEVRNDRETSHREGIVRDNEEGGL